jgi:predicted membrane protein
MRRRSHIRVYSVSGPGQIVLGVLVIAMGLLFLLDNLDIIDTHRALAFWPLAFIVAGAVKMTDTGSHNGHAVGLALIVVGAMLMLQRLGWIYFSWNTMWPLVMIGLGALVVGRALVGRRGPGAVPHDSADKLGPGSVFGASAKDAVPGNDAEVVDVTAILGGLERQVVTPTFRGGEVNAILGGCTLDMRGSSIQGEAVLNVYALFGGIEIKCPPDWTVVVHGTPILGGFSEKTATAPDANKRLIIRGYAIMGGVDVHN